MAIEKHVHVTLPLAIAVSRLAARLVEAHNNPSPFAALNELVMVNYEDLKLFIKTFSDAETIDTGDDTEYV